MGGNQSTNVLNDTLNQATMEVLLSSSNTSDTLILQSNYIKIGDSNKITGSIKQSNASKINLSSITTESSTADLQSAITNKLAEKLEQSLGTAPLAGQKMNITNKVRNVVDTNINLNTISAINTIVNQSNKAVIGNNNTLASSLVQENLSDAVISLVNNNTNGVLSKVGLSTTTDVAVSQTQKTFIDIIAQGIADNFSVALICGTFIVTGTGYTGVKVVESAGKNYKGYLAIIIVITLLILLTTWLRTKRENQAKLEQALAKEESDKAKVEELNRCGKTGEVYDPKTAELPVNSAPHTDV